MLAQEKYDARVLYSANRYRCIQMIIESRCVINAFGLRWSYINISEFSISSKKHSNYGVMGMTL